MITSFDHVAITVKDLDKTVEWYVKNMGFSVGRSIENADRGMRIVFMAAGDQEILEFFGFMAPEEAVEGPALKAEETGIKHISFFVDNLEEICQKLRSAGVEFTTVAPNRVVFKDLNGIALELRLA